MILEGLRNPQTDIVFAVWWLYRERKLCRLRCKCVNADRYATRDKNILKLNWSFRVLGVILVQDSYFLVAVIVVFFSNGVSFSGLGLELGINFYLSHP